MFLIPYENKGQLCKQFWEHTRSIKQDSIKVKTFIILTTQRCCPLATSC